MQDRPQGKYVYGFLASDNLTASAMIPLFDADGNSVTLAVGERLAITALSLNNGATSRKLTLFVDRTGDGVLNAGEAIHAAFVAAKANYSPSLLVPIVSSVIQFVPGFPLLNNIGISANGSSAGTTIWLAGVVTKS